MTDPALAELFEAQRPHLRAVAQRLVGSGPEAEDAVQEAWLRFARSDPEAISNLRAWLTAVTGRVCLDHLRARRSRRESALAESPGTADPERDAVLADSVGLALEVVMARLPPAERVALVLHDSFGLSFEEVAHVLGRSPAAARQLASRGRRRVQGTGSDDAADLDRRRALVEAFVAASRAGNVAALVALLDPEATLRADAAAVTMGAPSEVVGARAVAETFAGRAQAGRLALLRGEPGLLWAPGGRPRVAFRFLIEGDRVGAVEMVAEPAALAALAPVVLEG